MRTIALIGNPNSGKSSLFNAIAKTHQKVGNYPGVTVDVMSTTVKSGSEEAFTLLDMPGLYSIYPNTLDERIVVDILLDPGHKFHPDAIIYTADAKQLESQLLLFLQLRDLGFRMILAVNMIDEFTQKAHTLEAGKLAKRLGVPVIPVSSRTGLNLEELKAAIPGLLKQDSPLKRSFYQVPDDLRQLVSGVFGGTTDIYRQLVRMHHYQRIDLPKPQKEAIERLVEAGSFTSLKAQVDETLQRGDYARRVLSGAVQKHQTSTSFSGKLDRWLTHRVIGPIIFFVIMLFVFQAIFAWATYPMDAIESGFAWLGAQVNAILPAGWLTSLITDGLIAGLGGVMVFIPQIAILFFLITLLEEVGYMARAVYLFDNFLQRFGMSGRSMVALISGGACAIPAIMSTRTISNWRERLITILVTPFISCSARIPVFALLVAFVVPYEPVWGVFNTQGLAFAALYFLGAFAALVSGWVFKRILRSSDPSFLLLELPAYRLPDWSGVWVQVRTKVGAFVREAGKIIVLISIVLWALASYGPAKQMAAAEEQAYSIAEADDLDTKTTQDLVSATKLEASFAGHLGKLIEPVIRPLGYDWKIGIALITSFAAREVFVGSMATIYSVGSEDETFRIREALAGAENPRTGRPIFNHASALSLILFFLLAMQCMSTLAVVRKETGTWKWPIIQFVFMSVLAYVVSLAAYQLAT